MVDILADDSSLLLVDTSERLVPFLLIKNGDTYTLLRGNHDDQKSWSPYKVTPLKVEKIDDAICLMKGIITHDLQLCIYINSASVIPAKEVDYLVNIYINTATLGSFYGKIISGYTPIINDTPDNKKELPKIIKKVCDDYNM
jgi:hypothetical protein